MKKKPTQTMEITVNGARKGLPYDMRLAELLAGLSLPKHYVLELNRAVLPKSRVASHTLSPGDTIEIITAVGGG